MNVYFIKNSLNVHIRDILSFVEEKAYQGNHFLVCRGDTKYNIECSWYFTGMADEEKLPAHIAHLQKQD